MRKRVFITRHRKMDPAVEMRIIIEDFIEQVSRLKPALKKSMNQGANLTVSVRFGKSGGFHFLFTPAKAQILEVSK